MKKQIGTIDLTPTWESCVRIYVACLQNPDATADAKQGALQELLRLGRFADSFNRLRTWEIYGWNYGEDYGYPNEGEPETFTGYDAKMTVQARSLPEAELAARRVWHESGKAFQVTDGKEIKS